ncbi:MAG: M55 family metallopeptidase [Candidatus Hermodarchaeota archaeon]
MNILIFTDMEGPSGIDDPKMTGDDPEAYEKGRHFMTEDVNAAIRGLKKNGATNIDVFDGHGMGGNVLVQNLEKNANYLGGGWMTKLQEMIKEDKIKSYDGLVLLGQHAAEGTRDGFISHTNTGSTALKINEKFAGEAPQIAWLAGYYDVPTLMVVGDDAVIRETNALLPGVEGVVVKTSTSRKETTCIPIEEAHSKIEEIAYKQLKRVNELKPCKLHGPIKVEIFFALEEPADNLSQIVNFQRSGNKTVTYLAEDYLEAFNAYHSCRIMVKIQFRSMFLKWLKEREEGKHLIDEFNKMLPEMFTNLSKEFPVVKY